MSSKRVLPLTIKTGDKVIDDYLTQLNEKLAGTSSVRQITLNEIRDHLIEARDNLAGANSSEEAISTFGSIDIIAQAQRKERLELWWKNGTKMGLFYSISMLIIFILMGVYQDVGAIFILITFVFNTIFFGGSMGAFSAYAYAPEPPKSPTKEQSTAGIVYEVSSPKSSKAAAVIMCSIFSILSVLFILAALDKGPFAADFPWIFGHLLVAILGLSHAMGIFTPFIRFSVDSDGFDIHHPIKSIHRIDWRRISSFTRLNHLANILMPGIGQVHRLKYQTTDGKHYSVFLTLNMEQHNIERFKMNIEKSTERNQLTCNQN